MPPADGHYGDKAVHRRPRQMTAFGRQPKNCYSRLIITTMLYLAWFTIAIYDVIFSASMTFWSLLAAIATLTSGLDF